jgi:hypothetical protein
MGYKQNGFLLHGAWVVDRDRIGEWPDAGVASRILAPLAGEGLLARVDQISVWAADAKPLGPLEELDALAKPGDGVPFVLFCGSEDDPEVRIHVAITRGGVGLSLGMASAVMPAKVRERIAGWIEEWSGSLGELRCRLQSAAFPHPGEGYPRPRPPRVHNIWHLGALDLYLGRSWHEQQEETRAVLAKIETIPLPSSARRTSEEDVLQIAFEADLNDAAAVSAARRAQEDWLTPLVPAELERGWNELGDRIRWWCGLPRRRPSRSTTRATPWDTKP